MAEGVSVSPGISLDVNRADAGMDSVNRSDGLLDTVNRDFGGLDTADRMQSDMYRILMGQLDEGAKRFEIPRTHLNKTNKRLEPAEAKEIEARIKKMYTDMNTQRTLIGVVDDLNKANFR